MLDRENNVPLIDRLRFLFKNDVVEITQQGDILNFNIVDPEKWNNEIEKLKPFVGEMIFDEYGKQVLDHPNNKLSRDEIESDQLDISFKGAGQLFFYVEDNRIVGFSGIEYLKKEDGTNDDSTVFLKDILVDKNKRGKDNRRDNYPKELYQAIFKKEGLRSLISYTKTPQAIMQRLRAGEECGFATSFGNIDGNGNVIDNATTDQELMIRYLNEEGFVDEGQKIDIDGQELPPGFIVIDGKLGVLVTTPVDLLAPSDHKFYPALKILRDLQLKELERVVAYNEGQPVENQIPPNVIAGILISSKIEQ